jgi:cytochrome c peroxidase
MRVTNRPQDAFAFRTPSLRNVTLTAPYGHAGAYADLNSYLRAHAARGQHLEAYDLSAALLPSMRVSKPDFAPASDAADFVGITLAAQKGGGSLPVLSDDNFASLIAFLKTLEDPIAKNGGRMSIPDAVPSGLPIER